MIEEWRTLPDIPYYSISNLGRVRNKKKMLKQTKTGRGYLMVAICKDKPRMIPVHKLVASIFIRPILPKEVCHHKDGNKYNNRVDNLEYVTQSVNIAIAFNDGRLGKAHLNAECIKVIRWMLKYTNTSVEKLAEVYKTSKRNIYNIKSNKIWPNVTIGVKI